MTTDDYALPREHFDADYSRADYERERASERLDDEIAEAIEALAADHATDDPDERADFWSRVIAIAIDRATKSCAPANNEAADICKSAGI